MKKFIGPFAAIAASFVSQAVSASVPQEASDHVLNVDNTASEEVSFQTANKNGENHNFILKRTESDNVLMVQHMSHASHASHESHSSHYSSR